MSFIVDFVEGENVLFPVHNVQRTTEQTQKRFAFPATNAIAVFFFFTTTMHVCC